VKRFFFLLNAAFAMAILAHCVRLKLLRPDVSETTKINKIATYRNVAQHRDIKAYFF
jgi:hypothetical protein